MEVRAGRGAFVGRDDELAAVRSALEESASGRGRLVVLTGETGIGKTRLLEEAVHLARSTHVVLSGRAVEGGGAYRPIADALVGALRAGRQVDPGALGGYAPVLARLLPDWRDLAVPATEAGVDQGLVLGEAVARFLAAVGLGHPCLLVLEDLHWADADSLAVVTHLAGAVAGLPVLVLASVRDDEPGTGVVRRLARLPGVTTILLGRLSRDEVRLLATGTLGDADPHLLELLDRAEGLPFLAQELLAVPAVPAVPSADEPLPASLLPPTLLALVAERMASLTSSQRTVLSGAAVLGLDPDWSLLGDVTGSSAQDVVDALDLAVSARLLDAGAGSLRWRHALTRDAVLASVLPPQREGVARRAAEVLRSRGREGDDATAAQLLLDAGAADAAADLLLALARRHRDQGAYRTAGQNLDELDRTGLHPVAGAVERVRLLCRTGRAAEALEAGEPVVDRAHGEAHVDLALELARAAVLCGLWARAEEYVARAGRPDDPRSSTLLADAAHGAGDLASAAERAAEAVRIAEGAGDPRALCDALVVRAKIARAHDPVGAGRLFDRAAQVAAEHALVDARVEAMIGQATVRMMRTERIDLLLPARELAASAGLFGHLTGMDVIRVEGLMVLEGPAAAAPLARDLVERGQALQMPMALVAGTFVIASEAASRGDAAEVRRVLADISGEGPVEAGLLPGAVDALLALARHDLPGANAALDPAMAPLVPHGSAAPMHQFGLWALLRTVVDDRGEQARQELAATPASMRRVNTAGLRYAEAVALGRAGDTVAAQAALAEAEDLASAAPWLRRLLRQVALDSAVVDGWGDAVPLLRASLAEHEAAGEEAWAKVCRDLLRRAGAPTRRGRGDSTVPPAWAAAGVTSREADVLWVLLEGASNAEIAERLVLSRRTVETHVAHLLQKASVATRGELRERWGAQTP